MPYQFLQQFCPLRLMVMFLPCLILQFVQAVNEKDDTSRFHLPPDSFVQRCIPGIRIFTFVHPFHGDHVVSQDFACRVLLLHVHIPAENGNGQLSLKHHILVRNGQPGN